MRILRRFLGDRVARFVDHTLGALVKLIRNPVAVGTLGLLSLAKLSALVMALHLILCSLRVQLETIETAFTGAASLLLQFAAVQVPLSLGLQEGIVYGLLSSFGVAGASALAVGLLWKAGALAEIIVGLAFLPFLRSPSGASSEDSAS